MPSKFFTLAISCLLAGGALAQSPTPTPAPVGYVRFWNMLPTAAGAFSLQKSATGETFLAAFPYQYSSYTEFPAGMYNLVVARGGEAGAGRALQINLQPKTFFTVLISPPANSPKIELFNDTIDPKMTSGTLTLRNYFTGLDVSVATNNQNLVTSLPFGEIHNATGLPLAVTALTLKAKFQNGTQAESETEVDFRATRRATLLIIPDPYGRFRPRVTLDGIYE